jgi:hypothetical protein
MYKHHPGSNKNREFFDKKENSTKGKFPHLSNLSLKDFIPKPMGSLIFDFLLLLLIYL